MPLSESTKSSILSQHPVGRDCKRLADEHGVPYMTMYHFLRSHGVSFRRKTLTPDQEAELARDYQSGIRMPILAKIYGLSASAVSIYLSRLDIPNLPRHRRSTVNHDFFKTLTPTSLWVLGWIYTDGNMSKSSNQFRISVHKRDEEVLCRMRETMGIDTGAIYRREGGSVSDLFVCDKIMYADLISLGCMPAKSLIIEYPSALVEPWQHWAFLRGVVEGDGHISLKAKGNRPGFNLTIASGSQAFVHGIASVLKTHLCVDCHIRVREPETKQVKGREACFGTAYTLCILGGRDAVLKVLDVLYQDCGHHHLPRKYQTYLKMKEIAVRPHDMASINHHRHTEVYLRSPEGTVYHVRGINPFAREMNVPSAAFRNLLKPRQYRLERGTKWSIPTPDQISAARATNQLIERFY